MAPLSPLLSSLATTPYYCLNVTTTQTTAIAATRESPSKAPRWPLESSLATTPNCLNVPTTQTTAIAATRERPTRAPLPPLKSTQATAPYTANNMQQRHLNPLLSASGLPPPLYRL
jgi:hypothetical protein